MVNEYSSSSAYGGGPSPGYSGAGGGSPGSSYTSNPTSAADAAAAAVTGSYYVGGVPVASYGAANALEAVAQAKAASAASVEAGGSASNLSPVGTAEWYNYEATHQGQGGATPSNLQVGSQAWWDYQIGMREAAARTNTALSPVSPTTPGYYEYYAPTYPIGSPQQQMQIVEARTYAPTSAVAQMPLTSESSVAAPSLASVNSLAGTQIAPGMYLTGQVEGVLPGIQPLGVETTIPGVYVQTLTPISTDVPDLIQRQSNIPSSDFLSSVRSLPFYEGASNLLSSLPVLSSAYEAGGLYQGRKNVEAQEKRVADIYSSYSNRGLLQNNTFTGTQEQYANLLAETNTLQLMKQEQASKETPVITNTLYTMPIATWALNTGETIKAATTGALSGARALPPFLSLQNVLGTTVVEGGASLIPFVALAIPAMESTVRQPSAIVKNILPGLAAQTEGILSQASSDPTRLIGNVAGQVALLHGVGYGSKVGLGYVRTVGKEYVPLEKIGYTPEEKYPLASGQTIDTIRASFAKGTTIPAPERLAGIGEPRVIESARLPGVVPEYARYQAYTAHEGYTGGLKTLLTGKLTLQAGASELPGAYAAPIAESYFTKVGGQMPDVIGFPKSSTIIRSPTIYRTFLNEIVDVSKSKNYAEMAEAITKENKLGRAFAPLTKEEYEVNLPAGNVYSVKSSGYYTKVGFIRTPILDLEPIKIQEVSGITNFKSGSGMMSGYAMGREPLIDINKLGFSLSVSRSSSLKSLALGETKTAKTSQSSGETYLESLLPFYSRTSGTRYSSSSSTKHYDYGESYNKLYDRYVYKDYAYPYLSSYYEQPYNKPYKSPYATPYYKPYTTPYTPPYTPTYMPKYTPPYTPTYTPTYTPKYTPPTTPTYKPPIIPYKKQDIYAKRKPKPLKFKPHEQVFQYPFSPIEATKLQVKAIKFGWEAGNKTNAMKKNVVSSLPSMKVPKQPIKINAPKVSIPMPKIGSAIGFKSISLSSSLPRKKKGKK